MKYINLSGYPLRVDGVVIPVTRRAKVREVAEGDIEKLHYDEMIQAEKDTIVILPPEADEYGSIPTNRHALPDDLTWDAEARVFDCELDIYYDEEVPETEPSSTLGTELKAFFGNMPTFRIMPTLTESFGTPVMRQEDSDNFARDLYDKCHTNYNSAYSKVDDRLEELTYIYGKRFVDYGRVRDAFKENLSTEILVKASVDKTYVDKFFYNFFGISGNMPRPKNTFQATVNKGQQ